jgi:hypothetical protein
MGTDVDDTGALVTNADMLARRVGRQSPANTLTGCGKKLGIQQRQAFQPHPWMPGTRPGMTVSFDFNSFVMAGLVPAIHAPAGIPLTDPRDRQAAVPRCQ